jgi:hypothetical protein
MSRRADHVPAGWPASECNWRAHPLPETAGGQGGFELGRVNFSRPLPSLDVGEGRQNHRQNKARQHSDQNFGYAQHHICLPFLARLIGHVDARCSRNLDLCLPTQDEIRLTRPCLATSAPTAATPPAMPAPAGMATPSATAPPLRRGRFAG